MHSSSTFSSSSSSSSSSLRRRFYLFPLASYPLPPILSLLLFFFPLFLYFLFIFHLFPFLHSPSFSFLLLLLSLSYFSFYFACLRELHARTPLNFTFYPFALIPTRCPGWIILVRLLSIYLSPSFLPTTLVDVYFYLFHVGTNSKRLGSFVRGRKPRD